MTSALRSEHRRRVLLWLAAAGMLAAIAMAIARVWPAVIAEQRWQAVRARGVLRVGIDPGAQPFSFWGAQGWQGMDADVARELAGRLGLQVEAIPVGYDGFYDALATGRADVAMSALVVDVAKTADFVYSRPYLDVGLRMITLHGLPLTHPSELRGRCLAAALGSDADRVARWLERRTPRMERAGVVDEAEAMARVRSGACDATIVSGQRAIAEGCPPLGDRNGDGSLRCLPIEPVHYVLALPQADTRLIEALNRALTELEADGTLAHIARQWLATVTTEITATTATTVTTVTNQ